jgi:hypothetical protein
MTISAISSSSASFVATFQNDRQAFGQLASALQAGDLTAAQTAYSTLASSPIAQGNSPFAQALQQIGQDLQSGDLADAQKALASLQQQQQQARAHHHHHHHGGGPSETSAASNTSSKNSTNSTDNDGDTDGTTNILQISVTLDSDKVDIKA